MRNKVVIFVCLHDDLKNHPKEKLYSDYFGWLKTELENISGREVAILLNQLRLPPELTAFNYKSKDEFGVLESWRRTAAGWLTKRVKAGNYDPRIAKMLLLTRDNINDTVAGIAYQKGNFAIASILSYRAAAHEIGHMLNATHEDSAVEYDGWWHDSVMRADNFSHLRGNTYHFSEKNRENIRQYFEELR